VILIITDDLGNTGLSGWGSSFYETPHIDALAKSGVLFKNFYSASCLCSPARASLMTGKYSQRVGITEYIESTRKTGPHSHETTLPEGVITTLAPAPAAPIQSAPVQCPKDCMLELRKVRAVIPAL
jgi:arylsulfatase A-like enzyme